MSWSDYSGVSEYFGDDGESVNLKVSWQMLSYRNIHTDFMMND